MKQFLTIAFLFCCIAWVAPLSAQAQWTRDTVYDVITYNTDYTENGFNLHDQTESHKDRVYLVNGDIYNYVFCGHST